MDDIVGECACCGTYVDPSNVVAHQGTYHVFCEDCATSKTQKELEACVAAYDERLKH